MASRRYALSKKEINDLLEKIISNEEKLELIRKKIRDALKNLKGKRKAIFLAAALLLFLLGYGTPAYSFFMAGLREFLGGEDDLDSIKDYLVDIYQEYNAPFPEQLARHITQIGNEL